VTVSVILLPVAIMLARTVADVSLAKDSKVWEWADLVGAPIVALLIAVLVALYTFGFARGFDGKRLNAFVGESLAPAAAILLIIGAGGAFKQILIDSGIGDAIAVAAETASISALVLGGLSRCSSGSRPDRRPSPP
jgi:gluconate:H+ symporter, GntP family